MEQKHDDLSPKVIIHSLYEGFKQLIRLLYAELKQIICSKKSALWKDFLFFGGWGFLVFWLLVVKEWFVEQIPNLKPSTSDWPFALLSINVLIFLFWGAIFIALIANLLSSIDRQCDWLEDLKQHIESRFTELINMMISFIIGMMIAVLLYAVFDPTSEWMSLVLLMMASIFMSFILYIVCIFITRKIEPFTNNRLWNTWHWPLVILILSAILPTAVILGFQRQLTVAINIISLCMFIFAIGIILWSRYKERKQ